MKINMGIGIGKSVGLVGLALLLAGLAGCVAKTPDVGTVYQRLQSEDPAVRIQAAIEAGNKKDVKALPLLIDRLGDEESDVRMFSSMALKKIVGEKVYEANGWRFYDPAYERQPAIKKWREWLKKEHSVTPPQWEKQAGNSPMPTTQPS